MKILVVQEHPNRNSFTGALLDDLYTEEFDPCYNMADVAVYEGRAKASPEVAAEKSV
jgi:putative NADPH-quinone reductase